MERLTREAYLRDPCGTSSLPYWKAVKTAVPEEMAIVHDRNFFPSDWTNFVDEPYFRLFHDLRMLETAVMPDGFRLCNVPPADFAAHINVCYEGASVTAADLAEFASNPELLLAVEDCQNGELAATGIAALDSALGEGTLEWIQVAPAFRRRGLGAYLVWELLHRLRKLARFVTVSGQVNNPSDPEALYRKCGFNGDDLWHVLQKKR